MWCIPQIDQEFEERMLDVLDVYERPYDLEKPVVCLDEKSVELRASSRPARRAKPHHLKKVDSEYVRNGTANAFVGIEPKGRRRDVRITRRRTARDFARYVRHLTDVAYKEAKKLVLVMDNLNTHGEKALIDTFGEETGQRLWSRIEPHYTPKHASWLNMAEIEIGIFSRQCLAHRHMGSRQELRRQAACWTRKRNRKQSGISWQFTRTDAIKKFHLKRSYG